METTRDGLQEGREKRQHLFIVISGSPGSGKSILGRKLSAALGLPCFDKDDILEELFEDEGIGDDAWRSQLSRKSDDILRQRVSASEGGVIVSFWRPRDAKRESGTSLSWLEALGGRLFEVHCRCDPLVAAKRFMARGRHAGFLDQKRTLEQLVSANVELSKSGPMGVGTVLEIYTDTEYSVGTITAKIQNMA